MCIRDSCDVECKVGVERGYNCVVNSFENEGELIGITPSYTGSLEKF